jgi:hypothetical protein
MGRGLDGYLISVHWHCVVLKARERRSLPVSGGYSEGETPLPFPNRAVKPLSADGTWPARAWESRSPPVFLQCQKDERPAVHARCSEVLPREPSGVRPSRHLRRTRPGHVPGRAVRPGHRQPWHEHRRALRSDPGTSPGRAAALIGRRRSARAWVRGCAGAPVGERRANHVNNVPIERSGRHRGAFATWDVINVPR